MKSFIADGSVFQFHAGKIEMIESSFINDKESRAEKDTHFNSWKGTQTEDGG